MLFNYIKKNSNITNVNLSKYSFFSYFIFIIDERDSNILHKFNSMLFDYKMNSIKLPKNLTLILLNKILKGIYVYLTHYSIYICFQKRHNKNKQCMLNFLNFLKNNYSFSKIRTSFLNNDRHNANDLYTTHILKTSNKLRVSFLFLIGLFYFSKRKYNPLIMNLYNIDLFSAFLQKFEKNKFYPMDHVQNKLGYYYNMQKIQKISSIFNFYNTYLIILLNLFRKC